MIKLVKNILHSYHIFDWLDLFPYSFRMWYYDNVKPLLWPCHSRIRKAVPRGWMDITNLILDVNFEMLKSFYEEEYKANTTDWKGSSEQHAAFEQWLIKAYRYVTVERPILNQRLDNSYPPSKPFDEMFEPVVRDGKKFYTLVDDGIPYEVKYKDVIHFEKVIFEKDTEVLTGMITNREYFWT
jgi:hypothetical protein